MSFLYLKSSRLLKDNNGKTILLNNSELPYHFTNSFKDPIKITPNTKVEIVNADLNITPLHNINSDKNNDLYTYSLGKTSNQFLQKLVKLDEGLYSNDELSNKIQEAFKATNLLDDFDIDVEYIGSDKFEIKLNVIADKDDERKSNKYGYISQKMGFQASDAEQNAGVGSFNEVISGITRNNISNANFITSNSTLPVLTSTTLTNTTKPTNLISNIFTTSTKGIHNAQGTISTIFRPIKHLVFPTAYQTPTAGTTFTSVIGATTTASITINAPDSTNNDFKFTAGATTYHASFIKTKAVWDTITLPNSISTGNLPWGHFLILNTTDISPNTTLASNYCTLLLDTNDYKWKLFNAGTSGLSTFDFFSTTKPSFVKTTATLTSLGNWGSCGLGLTRGETAIVGTNQMDTTNKFTRARIYNTTGDADSDVKKELYADYGVVLTPSADGTTNYVQVQYGVQDATKVAGETDWITPTIAPLADDIKIENILENITSDDNVMITASMNSWYCLDIYITHDTAGNMEFTGNDVLIATTTQDSVSEHALIMPNNFTEASFPIMPLISPNNGYVRKEQQTLTFGIYSRKRISVNSLAKLNAYMITNWGSKQCIPARQPKATYTNYCRNFNLENRDVKISCKGFSGVNGTKTYTIINGKTKDFTLIEQPPIYMNLCRPIDRKSRLEDAGFDITTAHLPGDSISGRNPLINELYKELGMPKLLIYEADGSVDGDEHIFLSTDDIRYDNTATYVVNFDNLGKILGQNGETNSVSQIAAVIPSSELAETNSSGKHYRSQYPLPVSLNARTDELINNFQVSITNDDGTPATSLKHPTTILCRLTE